MEMEERAKRLPIFLNNILTDVRILILTQYYPPETGAPQNRLSSLAKYLACSGNTVEVLTAMPNYPRYEIFEDYKGKKYCKETLDGVTIHRCSIYVSKNKAMMKRLANYFSFATTSYYSASKRIIPVDIIICESPPLFLGITAVMLKRKWKCKLIFNVSDLWPESAEKMGIISNKLIIRRSYKLANWIYRNSDLISGQTQGIVEAIRKMQPNKKLFWFPNGVDLHKFENLRPSVKQKNQFILLYAGIIGHAQGLEVILRAAGKLMHHTDIHFYIIGDGPVKENLLSMKEELNLNNVSFIGNQPLQEVIEWLRQCDAYIVPLRKLDLFKGAIPSKLFEPLAVGKPILLGVEGEAKELFIDKAKGGLFFEPENANELVNAIVTLYNNRELAHELGTNGKHYVNTYFRRDKIAESFWQQLQQLYNE
jgi:glycosyltransferase involved in cell wall biosynthesis